VGALEFRVPKLNSEQARGMHACRCMQYLTFRTLPWWDINVMRALHPTGLLTLLAEKSNRNYIKQIVTIWFFALHELRIKVVGIKRCRNTNQCSVSNAKKWYHNFLEHCLIKS